MKTLLFTVSALVSSCFASAPLPAGDKLATNTVVAQFEKMVDRPCMFRTALCPDKCGHATKLALFKVVENKGYEKMGKYGDAKMEVGATVPVNVLKGVAGQADSVIPAIKALKAGDKVEMTILHFYTNENGSRSPIRPVTQFKVLAK